MSLEEQSQALETVKAPARHTARTGLTASEGIHEAEHQPHQGPSGEDEPIHGHRRR